MQLTEGTRMSMEDKKELERNIKELEKRLESSDNNFKILNTHEANQLNEDIKELRRLRRTRAEVEK